MAKFRKKPVVINAVQFWPWDELPEGVQKRSLGGNSLSIDGEQVQWFIKTLDGDMIVSPGDWIITGINGEKYPCKPEIFQKTYEQVD